MTSAILALIAMAQFAGAASAFRCQVPYPPNHPAPKSQGFCLSSGQTDRMKFDKKIDIDSIRVLRTDGKLECSELESDIGMFMFDRGSSSLVVGPRLETGCYVILWNEA